MKRAALIGMGDIFAIHHAVLRAMPGVEIAAVCDVQEEKRKLAPEPAFYTDYRTLLAREKPDCVHICLPHYLHYPVAADAVEAGCDVFCEKPLALDAAQANAFAALEKANPQRHIGVCLQNRYNKSTIALMDIISSGKEGRVVGIRAMVPWFRPKSYYDMAPWRGKMREAGGGVMINQSVHTLDLMYCFGGDIARIHGAAVQTLDYGIEVEDTAVAHLDFVSGAAGQFFATVACERNGSVEMEITLEKASYLIRDSRLLRRVGEGYEQIAEDDKMAGTKFYYGASHSELIGRFYRALENGGRDYPCAADAVMGMRMIDAISRSGRTGRAVDMREYEDEPAKTKNK